MDKRSYVTDRSTISLVEGILQYILGIIVVYLDYNAFFFISFGNYSVARSRAVFIMCLVTVCAVGFFFRKGRCMSTKGVLADLMIGTGIYTLFSYMPYYKKWFLGLAIVFCVLFILYGIYVFTRKFNGKSVFKIKSKKKKEFVIKSRVIRMLNTASFYLGLITILMLVPILYARIFHKGFLAEYRNYSMDGINNDVEGDYSIAANLDVIEKIRENARWQPLSIEEKLDVLQAVCDCETEYLGLDHRVTVVLDNLEGTTLGGYSDADRTVIIDRQHLEESDAHEVLKTCLHEMRHAEQHSLVRLYLDSTEEQRKLIVFKNCEDFLYEINNYITSDGSFEAYMEYREQSMELDSRVYAGTAIERYYREIDELQGTYDIYRGEIIDGEWEADPGDPMGLDYSDCRNDSSIAAYRELLEQGDYVWNERTGLSYDISELQFSLLDSGEDKDTVYLLLQSEIAYNRPFAEEGHRILMYRDGEVETIWGDDEESGHIIGFIRDRITGENLYIIVVKMSLDSLITDSYLIYKLDDNQLNQIAQVDTYSRSVMGRTMRQYFFYWQGEEMELANFNYEYYQIFDEETSDINWIDNTEENRNIVFGKEPEQ